MELNYVDLKKRGDLEEFNACARRNSGGENERRAGVELSQFKKGKARNLGNLNLSVERISKKEAGGFMKTRR